ncbi:hypothetical protein HPB52_014135 [Rhipicephalus sanguineus]|uniref:Uncharacterized protein n=1 Tax=Rhipicephalus sanguineus TaxID=34632 RepID=A0A9D4SP83_RHISA|nr:hypothetical protein HPB52_014135 [Rhipicephalus sanguineus]
MQAAREMSIEGHMYNFIAAFLRDRTFQVQVGNERSSYRHNRAWAQPGRSTTTAAAKDLWRSELEYLDEPKAPAIGIRRRLGRDSQNVNS